MSYRLVKSDGGDGLKSVASNTATDLQLIPSMTTTPTKESNAAEGSEKVLADLHKFMQYGVKMFEVQDDDCLDSDEDDDNNTEEESIKKLNNEPFDVNAFLRDLFERMADVKRLLEEEGAVQDDALELAHDIFEQCHEFANGDSQIDRASLRELLCKTAELLHKVRPVDLDLLIQLLKAGKDAGDAMQGKNVLLFIGQTG